MYVSSADWPPLVWEASQGATARLPARHRDPLSALETFGGLSNSVNGFHLYISKSFVSFDRKKNNIENSLTDLVNSTGKGTRRPVKLCRDGVASTAASLPASLVAAGRLPSKSGHVLYFFANFLLKVTQLTHAVPWVNFCSKIRGQ